MRDSTWGEFLAQLGGVVPWGTGSSLVGWGKFGVAVYAGTPSWRRISVAERNFSYYAVTFAAECNLFQRFPFSCLRGRISHTDRGFRKVMVLASPPPPPNSTPLSFQKCLRAACAHPG